jgi:hypothetical protein
VKIISFLATLFLLLTFAGCSGSKQPIVAVEKPAYDFLKATATVEQQETMRKQRDLAFANARFALKAQIKNELHRFLGAYLEQIGLRNDTLTQRLGEYVYMDMQHSFEAIAQSDIAILEERAMRVTASLDRQLFVSTLKTALTHNFRRDRTVWDRFQEQSAQDLLRLSLEALIQSGD